MCSGKAHNRQSYAIIIPQLSMFVSQLVYSWHVSHIISVYKTFKLSILSVVHRQQMENISLKNILPKSTLCLQ